MALPQPIPTHDDPVELIHHEIIFPSGLVGCPAWRRFTLSQDPDEPTICLLQLQGDASVNLLLAPVETVAPGFLARLHPDDRDTLAALGAGTTPEATVYCTLTVHDDGQITANLAGPIVIDHGRGAGTQVVLVQSEVDTRHCVAAPAG